jgi:hypothetical protein
MRKRLFFLSFFLVLLCSCNDDDDNQSTEPVEVNDEEWYSGGLLGTTFTATSFAYEQPAPAVDASMAQAFKLGEYFFENDYNENKTGAFKGLGPLMVRRGCFYCHPNYGHGKRQTEYRANNHGNGYLLVITDETDTYLSSVTGMPQTLAVEPFKAPIDESKIKIEWLAYTDEWGNKFPDGESYTLIYPEVTIPEEAYYVPLEVTKNGTTTTVPHSNVRVKLESTIGVYGTGLLDAIPAEELKAEYTRQEQAGVSLNPAIFANGNWTKTYGNTPHPLRYTYALSRGPLQDAAGANAIWNITNVTRSNRRYHYMTAAYATVASKDDEVQAGFYRHFPEQNKTGNVEKDIYNYLMAQDLDVEMGNEEYKNFMIWHRGLAVPAARNLDDPVVDKGKKLFGELGCTHCHRPSWTTGDDIIHDPSGFFAENDSRLPRFPNQKIWPYTDMVQHRLCMVNDIRTGWCRTTPLWGRGLSELVTGASDRLHDCRARNVTEAIMWHGSTQSDARKPLEQFRKLTKAERDAIVAFIDAI